MADLLRALEKKYEGDIAVHTANIMVYQSLMSQLENKQNQNQIFRRIQKFLPRL